ncbi:MAG TPA: hypothetical protein VKU01_10200 [Bryobacteraceae bacterium]|nr:hypothetical protein [Bryobacteraceae bacterium]
MFRLVVLLFSTLASAQVPRLWDDTVMPNLELPLSHPEFSPKHVTAEFYYKIPVRPIWKSYPVYHPDRMPAGYMEWLTRQEPQQVWAEQTPRTDKEWIEAGELVFDAPIAIGPGASVLRRPAGTNLYLLDKSWYERVKPPLTREGIVPFYRYVIRKKGAVEVGILACGMCHTRVMPDGSAMKGAQGNFPFDQAMADDLRAGPSRPQLNLLRGLYFAPWLSEERIAIISNPASLEGRVPGSITRHRSHPMYPIGIPDLIGVQERRYLDRTGLQQNRGIADIMRYAALNQGGDDRSSFGGFVPLSASNGDQPVTPDQGSRYSDEQLYALAKFLLALQPPSNPNRFDEMAGRGRVVFRSAGCEGCHPPPLYSNNKLTPAIGFRPPADHRTRYDILDIVVGTDPGLTMETRRGTGYYKVPSLRGVWNRGALSHTGQVKSLEEWLDPARLKTHQGHEFGLNLNAENKRALIAFLRTL